MDLSLNNFCLQIINYPALGVITFLICSVILFNGWSDVPNALTTSIVTRSVTPKKGLILAGIFNFLGVFVMAGLSTNVAQTIYKIANFGANPQQALIALSASLFAIVVWCFVAWIFGIPTSQNHALVAGLTGASIAICHGISGINFEQWIKVLIGLFIATFGGFILAYLITKIIEILFRDLDRRKAQVLFGKAQVFGDLSMVFMNGAQDGQKLLAILIMGTFLSNGVVGVETFTIPIWMLFLCSFIMTIGTWVGAKKIIKTIGVKMTKIETYQGTAADIASFVGLLFASFLGIPMSTTQTKITSVMGVGAAKRFSSVDWSIAKNIVITWFITFPGCGIMGYIFTNIIMKIFA